MSQAMSFLEVKFIQNVFLWLLYPVKKRDDDSLLVAKKSQYRHRHVHTAAQSLKQLDDLVDLVGTTSLSTDRKVYSL